MTLKVKSKKPNPKRFDLTNLSLCGARTKSGRPCKRRGTKHNGRCKFHGGKSTGPKTRLGKLKSSKNAGKRWPDWALGKESNQEAALYDEAIKTLELIKHRLSTPGHPITDTELNEIIEYHKESLEVMKFAILQHKGPDAFILVQSALDHYYQDSDYQHLACHIHFRLISSPYFPRLTSKSQEDYLTEYFEKAATKEMRKIERDLDKLRLYRPNKLSKRKSV
ncbi:hypothetical protein HJ030_21100 [Vibrio parahaemolyticus]|uniref:HGGxSTG domain-containing protein n=1 Tax=Vibrio parahaemolyticus TaxID=670 RepID=UPI00186A70A4|nr:HGGxSTG domain-containing protein [Vibrio parahaemolyticus]EHR6713959.1 hypothetical protein [Vibrio parahaemolyticus]MBE4385634.1 hypothetical protein [Vibrio parahaemolyticus]HCE1969746.1 hypothetical protein [Vibrio parahaemolyticus]HCG8413938.1 hypothetical protein [Vibrio parahaemolyticus]